MVVVTAIAADIIGRYANGMNAKMYRSARNENGRMYCHKSHHCTYNANSVLRQMTLKMTIDDISVGHDRATHRHRVHAMHTAHQTQILSARSVYPTLSIYPFPVSSSNVFWHAQ